jgi:hypothetical protein
MNGTYTIVVQGASEADANRSAADLTAHLQHTIDDLVVDRKKGNDETMDAGTILLAAFSTPAIVALAKDPAIALAKGIADWLQKRRGNITIGDVKIENVPGKDIEKVILAVLKNQLH